MANPATLLNYKSTGTGDTVVFLHGFMEDLSMWDGIIPSFENRTCIAVDLHGHGNSFFEPTLTPSLEVMAEQVRATLDAIGVASYILVGHSLGGYVACELLKTDPNIEHTVLLHSHPWPDSEVKKQDRDRVIEVVKTRSQQFIREAIPNLFAHPEKFSEAIEFYCQLAERMPPAAIGWSSAAMRDRPSSVDILRKKATDVTIIQGQKDNIIPNVALHELAVTLGVNWYELEDCGHMGHVEDTLRVIEILKVVIG